MRSRCPSNFIAVRRVADARRCSPKFRIWDNTHGDRRTPWGVCIWAFTGLSVLNDGLNES